MNPAIDGREKKTKRELQTVAISHSVGGTVDLPEISREKPRGVKPGKVGAAGLEVAGPPEGSAEVGELGMVEDVGGSDV